MREVHILKASILAKEAKALEEKHKMLRKLQDEQGVVWEHTIEKKKIESLKEVKLAKQLQTFVNKSRNDAGQAFVNDHDENDRSDEEVDFNDAIETSSVAEQLEELGDVDEEDLEEPIDVDAMIVDAMGSVDMRRDH